MAREYRTIQHCFLARTNQNNLRTGNAISLHTEKSQFPVAAQGIPQKPLGFTNFNHLAPE